MQQTCDTIYAGSPERTSSMSAGTISERSGKTGEKPCGILTTWQLRSRAALDREPANPHLQRTVSRTPTARGKTITHRQRNQIASLPAYLQPNHHKPPQCRCPNPICRRHHPTAAKGNIYQVAASPPTPPPLLHAGGAMPNFEYSSTENSAAVSFGQARRPEASGHCGSETVAGRVGASFRAQTEAEGGDLDSISSP